MGYSVTQQGDTVEYNVIAATIDTRQDIATLPIDWKAGSSAFCIEDSSVWMLDTNKEWKEL